jgi:hypothetical protein
MSDKLFTQHDSLMESEATSPPARVASTFCHDVSNRVLKACKTRDPQCVLSSVLRDSEGRTVVRVRSGDVNNPLSLLHCMTNMWPLAKTAVVENQLDGTVEAQIVIPLLSDERSRARSQAKSLRVSEFLLVVSLVLFLMGVLQIALDAIFTDVPRAMDTEL